MGDWWGSSGGSSGGSDWWGGGGSSGAKKKSSGGESTFLGSLFGGIAHTVESAVHPVESAASWLEPDWIKPANQLAANFAQGIYATGRASVVDVKNHPETLPFGPAAPIAANIMSIAEGHGGGQLTKKVIEPTGKAYQTKYGGLNPWDFRPGDVAHNVAQDPFGTALDVAALGTVPFGGEGVAIRGAALSERVGLEETALGRAINTAAKAADEARAPREVAYKPNTAEGGVFQASRARTVQGRYVYNPVREAVGKSFQGRLPVIGNQARFAKYVRQMSDIHLGSEYALLKEFDRTLGAHVLKSKRLTSGERVALDYIPGYGPETAKAAPLGAPRQQLVDFYTAARDQITQALQDPGLAKGPKTQAKIELKAVSRKLTLLDKHGAEIDQAFKTPRPIMEQALTEAKGVADAIAGWMTEAKLSTPEQLAQRPFLEQRLLRGQPAQSGDQLSLDVPLDNVPLEHPDAFYRPHTGPPLKNDASTASGWRGGPNQAPGVSKQNTGYRFSTGQTESGGHVWTKAGQQVLKYRSIGDQIERLRPVMVPYDGGLEHPLLPGYTPVNPDGVSLSRGQREIAPADEQLHGLTSSAEHAAIDKHLNTLFPPESAGTVSQYQIPKGLADRIKGDYSRAGIVTRNLFDRPLAIWKALVLKNRPAWLINNLFGQHVLLLLHNGLHWTDYVQSLRPEKRRQLEKGIHGILQSGTTRLAGGASFTGGRRERAMAGYYGKGPRAAALAGKGVTTVLGAWGNGIAKLNQELADNVPRTTLARRYVREQKHVMRRLEVAHGAVESAVKGKTIEEVAQLLSPEQKAEILRKVNLFLGDFNSLGGASGRRVRRVLPFAAWFKVILRITQDLSMDHPEKLVLVKNLEAASAKDPSVDPGIDLPSWLQGSLLAAYAPGESAPGTEPLLSTTAINPFQTPVQLTQQVSSLFKKGTPTATDNPVASLGPLISAINLAQGVDPFYGGTYSGPGASSSPIGRAIAGTVYGLPETRLLQAGGVAPGYTPTKSYHDTYVNVNGHQVPLDALLRYFGYPLRRVDKKAAATYAKQGR